MTSPKKEIFLERYQPMMDVPVMHGVGGSFDILAGRHEARPRDAGSGLGMEWAYRLVQEPGRLWKRYLPTNVLFSVDGRPRGPGQPRPRPSWPRPISRTGRWRDGQPLLQRDRRGHRPRATSGCPPRSCSPPGASSVIGVDVNQPTVDRVARGEIPFFEPDLATSLSGAVAAGEHRHQYGGAGRGRVHHRRAHADHPERGGGPQLRLGGRRLHRAAARVRGAIVVLESTSPPGHHRGAEPHAGRRPSRPHLPERRQRQPADIHVAHCPERVLPGSTHGRDGGERPA